MWLPAGLVIATCAILLAPTLAVAASTGAISGTVSASSTGLPIEGIKVCVREVDNHGFIVGCTSTNADGAYELSSVAAGAYHVEFAARTGVNYVTQFYNDRATLGEADPVTVTAGSTTPDIDAEMAEGGQITGRVSAAATQAPIEGITACALEADGGAECARSNASGEYTIVALPSGSYPVMFYAGSGANYARRFYDDRAGRGEADTVAVVEGGVVENVNEEMIEGGRITGRVVSAVTQAPIEGVRVCAYEIDGESEGECASTGSDGTYVISGLSEKSYRVSFEGGQGGEYAGQYYDDKPMSAEPDPVAVTLGATTENVDAELIEGGAISGKVIDASTKSPVGEVEVCAAPVEGGGEECSYSSRTNGDYSLAKLTPGSYVVSFTSEQTGYLREYYEQEYSREEATSVVVTAGETATGIDAEMVEGGGITGTVTDAATKAPVEGVKVCAFDPSNYVTAGECASTSARGEYTIIGLPAGLYDVEFSLFTNSGGYLPEFYDDVLKRSEATSVSVALGATTANVNAEMNEGGQISGRVTAASTHAPIEGIRVCASAGEPESSEGCASTDASGEYTITHLQPGSYRVNFSSNPEGGHRYVSQYYDGTELWEDAQLVTVAVGVTTSNIDAEMSDAATKVSEGPKIGETVTVATLKTPPSIGTAVAGATTITSSDTAAVVVMRCTASGACSGTVQLIARLTRKHMVKHRAVTRTWNVVIGESTFSIARGETATLHVKLNGEGKVLLRHAGKRGLKVRLTGSDVQSRVLVLK